MNMSADPAIPNKCCAAAGMTKPALASFTVRGKSSALAARPNDVPIPKGIVNHDRPPQIKPTNTLEGAANKINKK